MSQPSSSTNFIRPAQVPEGQYQYTGRIDLHDAVAPVLYYAGSYITARFQGTALRIDLSDEGYWNANGNQVGLVVDGGEPQVRSLVKGAAHQVVELNGLADGEHTLSIVKLQGPGNGRGGVTFHGLALEPGKRLLPPPPLPRLKIEAYGDSITEGEGASCPDGTNDCDPNAGNGWLSYTNVLARHLNVQVHNLGIGGLAVLNGTGWYEDGKTGLETTYDKLNPSDEHKTPWDFSRYQPDLVLMAMGVNDQSKGGFNDLPRWRSAYKRIVHDIHARHGGGDIPFLFAVPPIHVEEACRNVAQVAEELKAEGLNTFYYRYRSGEADGHPNRSQSARMGRELYEFIVQSGLLS